MVSKTLIALALFVALAFGFQTEKDYQLAFTQWMQTYRKSYNHDEFQTRYQTFKANSDFIADHNSQNKGFTVKMNEFGDLNSEEFGRLYRGTRITVDPATLVQSDVIIGTNNPASVDWVTKGAVTGIKNQGQCGSCWSFSTTGSTEGCHFLTKNQLVGLSEQNLMDCSTAQGNMGCNGGLMTQAMDYIISNGGIDTESSYPYTAQDGTCNYNSANSGATLSSYKNVQSGSESALETATVAGPVSVAIDASQSSFQFYSSGVYYEPNCSSTQLDHGVLSAGYGTDSSSGSQYWLVKNSWGTGWGQQGYIWMSRNRNNNCGIATMATLPSC